MLSNIVYVSIQTQMIVGDVTGSGPITPVLAAYEQQGVYSTATGLT
jgi:hypothetical protein